MGDEWKEVQEQQQKQLAELDAKLAEYWEKRQEERHAENEKLDVLKAEIEQRKMERNAEIEEMAERMREAEERRRADEEAKRAVMEEERQKRLEAKRKTGGTSIYDVFGRGGGPQEGKKDISDEEKAAMKSEYLSHHCPRPESIQGLGADDLKERIKDLHNQICKLEASRYDLEERQKGQEYDLKELMDRQSQQARQNALKMGLDAEEAAKSKHPPKVKVVAKFDRQIDRRGYGERKELFRIGQTQKIWKVFHGSGKPPAEWGRKESEELENIRKNFEGFKYKEVEEVEGAKPPVPTIPAAVPEGPEFEEIPVSELMMAAEEAVPPE